MLQVFSSYVKKCQGYDVGKRARPVRVTWHTYGITVTGTAAEQLMRDAAAKGGLGVSEVSRTVSLFQSIARLRGRMIPRRLFKP